MQEGAEEEEKKKERGARKCVLRSSPCKLVCTFRRKGDIDSQEGDKGRQGSR